jgi:hypothetical protein
MTTDNGQTMLNGEFTNGPAGKDGWPRSYKVYRVTNTFEIVAHSEDQAKKRFRDLMSFLDNLAVLSDFPHPVVRYVRLAGEIDRVELDSEEVYHSRADMGISTVSNMEYLSDWWDPESDASLDSARLAHDALFAQSDAED